MTSPEEYFSRSIMLYGREGFEVLGKSTVAVVGLGGVGSWAAEALCRAGVGGLRLIDCDTVKATDVNRQLIALRTNEGVRKVDAAEERLRQVNPEARLDPRHAFFHHDTADELLGGDIDFVIDAIDSMNPKSSPRFAVSQRYHHGLCQKRGPHEWSRRPKPSTGHSSSPTRMTPRPPTCCS